MSRDGAHDQRVSVIRPPRVTSSGSSARAGRSGTRSTGLRKGVSAEEDRAGLDGSRSCAGRLVHEARRGGLAARRPRPGGPRHAGRDGADGRDVRGRRGGVAAVHRGGPGAQAVDAARSPVGFEGTPVAGVRRLGARIDYAGADRCLVPWRVEATWGLRPAIEALLDTDDRTRYRPVEDRSVVGGAAIVRRTREHTFDAARFRPLVRKPLHPHTIAQPVADRS